jgi:hypothetical protein
MRTPTLAERIATAGRISDPRRREQIMSKLKAEAEVAQQKKGKQDNAHAAS